MPPGSAAVRTSPASDSAGSVGEMVTLEALIASLPPSPDLTDIARDLVPPPRFRDERFATYHPRHPSQLYEGVLEGVVLTMILWFFLPRVKRYGVISAVFLIGYGIFRYIVEFFREADEQLGYYFGGTTTMGQILCLIMIAAGVAWAYYANKKGTLVSA